MFDPYEPLDLNDGGRPPHLSLRVDEKYDIQHLVGAGRTARVYAAKCFPSKEMVAIKILREACSAEIEQKRLEEEGVALSRIDSPYFARFIDSGVTEKGEAYLVSELFEGVTLEKVLDDYRHLEVDRALSIAIQISDALSVLHSLGIVHGSFRPADVVLSHAGDRDYKVHLVDLDSVLLPHAPELNQNAVLGEGATFHYISPEQALSQPLDEKTDVYNCCLVLYEMLAGRHPYNASTLMEIMTAKANSSVVPLQTARPELDLPAGLEALVMGGLSADKRKRSPDIVRLKTDLERIFAVTPKTEIHPIDENEWNRAPRKEAPAEEKKSWISKIKGIFGG